MQQYGKDREWYYNSQNVSVKSITLSNPTTNSGYRIEYSSSLDLFALVYANDDIKTQVCLRFKYNNI